MALLSGAELTGGGCQMVPPTPRGWDPPWEVWSRDRKSRGQGVTIPRREGRNTEPRCISENLCPDFFQECSRRHHSLSSPDGVVMGRHVCLKPVHKKNHNFDFDKKKN